MSYHATTVNTANTVVSFRVHTTWMDYEFLFYVLIFDPG